MDNQLGASENDGQFENILKSVLEKNLTVNDATQKAPWWSKSCEDVVISGISGRFPNADNMNEFMQNLFDGVDMITEDNKRWDPGFYDLPKRHGKLNDLTKFDARFFGITPEQATVNDPQLNLLLETAYEAIYDAGLDPFTLRGTKTGVYVGNSPMEIASVLLHDWEKVNEYTFAGTSRTMLANQLSFCFDFKGPSLTFDTACSSTMLAFQNALDAIRKGDCDSAIVAGAHLTLIPTSAVMFLKLGMLSPKGMCQTFDAKGDGYVRSECVGCVFIQKSSSARRCYATVIHAKSNTDGYKEQGITFPSAEQQANLLRETYGESGVSHDRVTFVEAHGTGTKVGDVIEGSAITAVLTKDRKTPLLIGSVKSNAGHAESASGIISLAKVIIAMETEIIPKNLHYNEPNNYVPALSDGRLKVVSDNTPWNPDIVGINSFGFGGSNTHIILKPNFKTKDSFANFHGNIPILLFYTGRTVKGLSNIFDLFCKNKNDMYLYSILMEQYRSMRTSNLFPYHGYLLLESDHGLVERKIQIAVGESTELYFLFSARISQQEYIITDFCKIPAFKQLFISCLNCLISDYLDFEQSGVVVVDFVKSVAFQMALFDFLKLLNITFADVIGINFGKILALYATGFIDRKTTMIIAYHVAQLPFSVKELENCDAFNMSWDRILQHLPKELADVIEETSNYSSNLWKPNSKCLKTLPEKSTIIEIFPNSLQQTVFKGRLETLITDNSPRPLVSFFSILGGLYLEGINMQIRQLYPEVDYPVPRGTAMLSYLFDWDHSQTWNIYTAAQKNLNCVCTFVVDPFAPESKKFLGTYNTIHYSLSQSKATNLSENNRRRFEIAPVVCWKIAMRCTKHSDEFIAVSFSSNHLSLTNNPATSNFQFISVVGNFHVGLGQAIMNRVIHV